MSHTCGNTGLRQELPCINCDCESSARPASWPALLEWSLHVDCPKCEHSNDLASGDHDSEHQIAHHIFHNTWDKLQGWEVTCEECGHEFTISGAEY